MSKSKIQWTERTWNPVRGCSRISPGCVNCYAERHAARFCGGQSDSACKEAAGMEPGGPFHLFAERTPSGPRWTGKVELIKHMLDVPLRVKKPTVWFVNSMSDLFHEALADEAIIHVLDVIRRAHCLGHTFQILTKRALRMRNLCSRLRWDDRGAGRVYLADSGTLLMPLMTHTWLGVSVEDQQRANERIPLLLQTPAAIRFLSVEPLLGPVDLMNIVDGLDATPPMPPLNALTGWRASAAGVFIPKELRGIDWIIVGGESGPGARPMDLAWARSIVEECKAAGVAVFVKQLGAKPLVVQKIDRPPEVPGFVEVQWTLTLRDKKGGDISEWPADLRVREFPPKRFSRVGA